MSEYLNFEAGANNCWLTSVKFSRGDNQKPRNKITLGLTAEPSSVTFSAPFTKQEVYLPMSSDSVQAKIAMERRIKEVLYPLAGFEPAKKTSIKEIFEAISANLVGHDLKLAIQVKQTEGKQPDREGNVRMFSEITSLTVEGYEDKKEFKSDIDYGTDEVAGDEQPF